MKEKVSNDVIQRLIKNAFILSVASVFSLFVFAVLSFKRGRLRPRRGVLVVSAAWPCDWCGLVCAYAIRFRAVFLPEPTPNQTRTTPVKNSWREKHPQKEYRWLVSFAQVLITCIMADLLRRASPSLLLWQFSSLHFASHSSFVLCYRWYPFCSSP